MKKLTEEQFRDVLTRLLLGADGDDISEALLNADPDDETAMQTARDAAVQRVVTFADAMLLTRDEGIVVHLLNGQKFQVTVQEDLRGY